ncbi:ABC transporter [Planctomycetota bacterium]|nr:ABC transporter [Planctomycetota bacterium]
MNHHQLCGAFWHACLLLAVTWVALIAADKPAAIRIGLPQVGAGGRPLLGGSVVATVHGRKLLEAEFKADGIPVEWTLNKGAGPVVNEQLAGGLVDFACYGDLAAIIGRGGGIPTRLLLAGGRGSNIYLAVRADSPVRTLDNLKGKRLVVFKGTAIQLLAARLLAQRGLSEGDFRSIVLDNSAAVPALLSGDVDAIWGINTILEFQQRGDLRIIASSREPPPAGQARPTFQNVLVVKDDFAARHPDLVQRVVTVFVRTAALASDEANREDLFTQWAESGTPAAVFREDFTGDTLAARHSPLLDAGFLAVFKTGIDWSLQLKLIRAPIALDAWIDDRYLQRALRELKLNERWTPTDVLGQPISAAKSAP